MLYFISAVYNEEQELNELFRHVLPIVDGFRVVDDGSEDNSDLILRRWGLNVRNFEWRRIQHIGLPETVKNEALQMVPDESWVLMLDADERIPPHVLKSINEFVGQPTDLDYVYFNQLEIIDGQVVRNFQKAKLFRKEAIQFPLNNIHADDVFTGNGDYRDDWIVLHRKTSEKQIRRETEYLATYKKLLTEGKIDQGRYEWLVGLHHFVKPHG
jgi:glycosyltransferase involved in cell wall biosynthesis